MTSEISPACRRDNEGGAALATVLMMVAIMSLLAVAAMDLARFAVRRTQNEQQMDQVRWHLLGAEAYANSRINRALSATDAHLDVAAWIDRPFTLPLDTGDMKITIRDGENCFNVNSVTSWGEGGGLVGDEGGKARFAWLTALAGEPGGFELAATLADWIDTDIAPSPGGAEDDAYAGRPGAVLPSNTLMADLSELRAVMGFDDKVLQRLAPFLCARPTAAPTRINVNTLRKDQAVLLASVLGREVSLVVAERVIAERPRDGWPSIDVFLAQPALYGLALSRDAPDRLCVAPNWYVISIRVRIGDVVETSLALADATAGRSRIVRRVFGVDLAEASL